MDEYNRQPYVPQSLAETQKIPIAEPDYAPQQPVEPRAYVPQQPAPPVYIPPQQPVQQQPVYIQQQPPYDPTTQVMSVGAYIGMFILSAIPIVNIICWIVWLVSSDTNKNKKNYLIACIVLWAISILLSVALFFILLALGYDLTKYINYIRFYY